MNDDKEAGLRSILNEIDAKEYLLRVAKRYGIPREEIEATKIQLRQYKEELGKYLSNKVVKMKYKVVSQWRPLQNELCVLYLDKAKTVTSTQDDYRYYQIDGMIYSPVSMSHTNGKCIAIKGTGDFVGKEVEFVNELLKE